MKCPDCKSKQITEVVAYNSKEKVITVKCRMCGIEYVHDIIHGTDIKKK